MTQPSAYQDLRDALQRMPGEEFERLFERIFPQSVANCVVCGAKHVPCRRISGVLEDGCGRSLCLKCFQIVLDAGVAVIYGADELLPTFKAQFNFQAIGKNPPELTN